MSTTTTTAGRADRLARHVDEHELDLLVISASADVRYLTGYTGSNGVAVLGPGAGRGRLFLTDFRYLTQVERQVGAGWDKRLAAQELIGPGLVEHLPSGDDRTLRIGFDDAHITVKQHARLAGLLGDRA